MRVFGPIVNQQQNLRSTDRVGEQIEESLCALVDPMEVLEDHHQRLIERLAQHDALDRIQRVPLSDLGTHSGKTVGTLNDSEEAEEVRQRILKRAVQRQEPADHSLAPLARVIFCSDVEVGVE